MEGATRPASVPFLLSLPRELRDEIYGYLVLPQCVFKSTTKSDNHSLHRAKGYLDAHLDSRVYLPAQPYTNVLGTCRQLREEYLYFVTHLLRSRTKDAVSEPATVKEMQGSHLATTLDEMVERARDDGTVRITMEIMRAIYGNYGSYTPTRTEVSPRFLTLLPFISQLNKVKFVVWAGWPWWKGPEEPLQPYFTWEKIRTKRIWSDQTDELQSTRHHAGSVVQQDSTKLDPVSVAIQTVSRHLPLLEDIDIDVLIHASDYWNWDLPDNRWEGIQAWLDSLIMLSDEKAPKRVYRRLLVCEPLTPFRAAVFYHKLEEWDNMSQSPFYRVIHISEGAGDVPENWDETTLPTFTKTYDRMA